MNKLILLTFFLLPLLTFSQIQLGPDLDGEAVSDFNGYSVSIDSDGSHVAIGAKSNDKWIRFRACTYLLLGWYPY